MKKSRLLAFASIAALVSAMLIGCSGSPSSDFYDEMPTEPKMYVAPGEVPSTPSEEQKLLVSQLDQYGPDILNNDSMFSVSFAYPGTYSNDENETVTVAKFVFKLSDNNGDGYGEFLDSKGIRHTVSMNYERATWKGTVTIDGNTYETREPEEMAEEALSPSVQGISEADSQTLSLFLSLILCDGVSKLEYRDADMNNSSGSGSEDLPARKASGTELSFCKNGVYKTYKDLLFDDGNKLQYVKQYSRTTKQTMLFVRLNGVLLDPAAF